MGAERPRWASELLQVCWMPEISINLTLRFFLTGSCNSGTSCRHSHDLKRLGELHAAHSGTINSVILAEGLIWTGGADTSLRSWRPMPSPSGIEIQPAGPPVECGEPVTALLWDPVRKSLICGLNSGIIRVYTRDPPAQMDLVGHTGAVYSLVLYQNILLSASWDGSVRTWKDDQLSASVSIPASTIPTGSIRVMKVFAGRIWIGGVTGVCAIDMLTLQVVLSIGCDAPVMSLVEFSPTESVIVATLKGSIKIINYRTGMLTQSVEMSDIEAHYGIGQQSRGKGRGKGHHVNYSWNAKSASSSAGIITFEGMMMGNSGKPVIVVGDQTGTCRVLELPTLELKGQWFAHAKGSDIRNILNTNENNIFITTASDGCMAVWQWQI